MPVAASLLDELGDHLQVVYGAALALGIVLVLTPAVGRVGRLLGVVDRPDGRRMNVRPIPRLGGLALFFGIIVPALAVLDDRAGGVGGSPALRSSSCALSWGKPMGVFLPASVSGAALGSSRHTFYPARIFMGDSGALLLGFVLGAVSIQGLLKTAATVALFFPLLVLAVPIVDTTFVVVRRLKHGEPVFEGDQAHLHHRFLRRGFTQRRAALTIWGWCITLAAAAFATRFVPFRAHGVWHLWWTLLAAAIALVALGISVYVVYVLEIVKVANPYLRRREAELRKSA